MDVNHFLTDVFLGTIKTHEPDTHTHLDCIWEVNVAASGTISHSTYSFARTPCNTLQHTVAHCNTLLHTTHFFARTRPTTETTKCTLLEQLHMGCQDSRLLLPCALIQIPLALTRPTNSAHTCTHLERLHMRCEGSSFRHRILEHIFALR